MFEKSMSKMWCSSSIQRQGDTKLTNGIITHLTKVYIIRNIATVGGDRGQSLALDLGPTTDKKFI